MPPVRIKYYGLIPMTKRTYLLTLGLGLFIALAFLAGASALGRLPPMDTLWSKEHHARGDSIWALVHNYMWLAVVICLVAQAFDTWVTLRVFAKKEAEARAAQPSEAVTEKLP